MIRTIRVVGELAGAVVSMALLSIVMLSISPFADATSAATVNVVNAIQFKDASGNLLHAHGGGMIKVGSFYYWFGENRDGTNLVSAYRSTDLKSWTFRAHVLRKNMGGELATANIERPKVLFNALDRHLRALDAQGERRRLRGGPRRGGLRVQRRGAVHVPRQLPAARIRLPRHDGLQRQRHRLPDLGHEGERRPQHLPPHARISWASIRSCARYGRASTGKRRPCSSAAPPTSWSRPAPPAGTRTRPSTRPPPASAGRGARLANFADATTFGSQSTYVVPVQGSSTTSYLVSWATAGPAPGAGRSTIPSTCGCL